MTALWFQSNNPSGRSRFTGLIHGILAAVFLISINAAAAATDDLSSFLSAVNVGDIFPAGTSFGDLEGNPHSAPVFGEDGSHLGHVFLNTDFAPSIGYSGKPIHILIAMDNDGVIAGARVVKHAEPIVLVEFHFARLNPLSTGMQVTV